MMNNVMTKTRQVLRGDVWLVDLGSGIGSEQQKTRPCIIVQNNIANRHAPTVTILPISSQMHKKKLPTHVAIEQENYLPKESFIMAEQIRTVAKERLMSYMGSVRDEILEKISKAIDIQNKEFDIQIAKEKLYQIINLKKVIDKISTCVELEVALRYAIQDYKNYCTNYNKNCIQVKQLIKTMCN